jgi:hypothetical protein
MRRFHCVKFGKISRGPNSNSPTASRFAQSIDAIKLFPASTFFAPHR